MWTWITNHQLISAIGAYYIFSNAIDALPPSGPNSSAFYKWFFVFGHGFAGNLKYAFQKAAPQYVDSSK